MTFGDAIAAFGEQIVNMRPWRTITDWEQGVRVRAGRANKLLTSRTGWFGSGFHLLIPLVDKVHEVNSSIEVVESTVQSCTTANGEAVSFNLALRYQVVDAVKAYLTILEVDKTVLIQARASAGDLVGTIDCEELDEEGKDFANTLTEAVYSDIHERLAEWGIELQEVSLSTCVFCRTYRVIGHGQSGD